MTAGCLRVEQYDDAQSSALGGLLYCVEVGPVKSQHCFVGLLIRVYEQWSDGRKAAVDAMYPSTSNNQ
jgi:hypothetical protein